MKLKIKVTATVEQVYEIEDTWFDLVIETPEQLIAAQQAYLDADPSGVLEDGRITNLKVEKAEA